MTDERAMIAAFAMAFVVIPAALGAFSTSGFWQSVSDETAQAHIRAEKMFDPLPFP